MATGTNSIPHRVASLLCLLTILLAALPYATCASTPGHSMASMPVGHCCPAGVSATAPCCLAHPQPAVAVSKAAQTAASLIAIDLPSQRHHSVAAPETAVAGTRTIPPPQIRTNLRL